MDSDFFEYIFKNSQQKLVTEKFMGRFNAKSADAYWKNEILKFIE